MLIGFLKTPKVDWNFTVKFSSVQWEQVVKTKDYNSLGSKTEI